MPLEKEEVMMLGRIDGKLDGISAHLTRQDKRMDQTDARLDAIDARLRDVEKKAAVAGAVSGGAVAVGTALIVEGLRQILRGGGPGLGN